MTSTVGRRLAAATLAVRGWMAAGGGGRSARAGLALIALMALIAPGGIAPAWARGAPDSFADLAQTLSPAVVNISTTQAVAPERGPDIPQFPPGSPFDDFFREFLERHRDQQQRPRKATSLGSGFVIDPTGYVVTNNHVIADAVEITVILHDNTALKARVIGKDGKTDVALLKVETDRKLPAVTFGDSDKVRVGDWVVAIGNPYGLGGSVTAGIISARARNLNNGPYDDFLQTDAAINLGNSGGPLFNLNGEVIGINTAIYSRTGGNIGIGFAMPSNLARTVIADLRQYGRTRRGWLGVRIQEVNEDIADSLGLGKVQGALVANVSDGGPAATAGIKPGDVVISFDNRPVEDNRRLPRMVAETAIGRTVDLVVFRDGKEKRLKVTVGELNEAEAAEEGEEPEEEAPPEKDAVRTKVAELGLAVSPLSADLRRQYDLPETVRGVVVVAVEPGSDANEKGVRPGDVIVEMNQNEVADPADVRQQLGSALKANRKTVLLLVANSSGLRFVPLKVGKS